jgi:hypothetical protein
LQSSTPGLYFSPTGGRKVTDIVFQAIHGRFFPLEVVGLDDHMRNVLKLQSQKGQWRSYDLKVRLAIQNGFLKWGEESAALLAEAMLPVRDQRSGSGPRPKVVPVGFCKQGKCKARECAFKHICFLWEAQHSVLKCEKKEQQLALLTELARGKKIQGLKTSDSALTGLHHL